MIVAYDPELRRPACVLVAAGMGGETEAARKFPVKSWLLAPTANMQLFETTEEQLQLLVSDAEARFGKA